MRRGAITLAVLVGVLLNAGCATADTLDEVAHALHAPDDAGNAAEQNAAGATPQAVARRLEEAEALYRARRWSAAMDAFKAVLALDPASARAWLRVGNLHQRRSQWLSAASAYRRAADRADREGDEPAVRAKALVNLASVNLELAAEALADAEALGGDGAEFDEARRQVRAQWSRMRARAPGGESPRGASSP